MATTVLPRAQVAAPTARFFHGAPPRSVELHPQGRLLLVASRDCVRLLRAETGETVCVLPGFPERVAAEGRFVFLADGSRVAGFVTEANVGTLRVYATSDGEELTRLEGESIGPIVCAAGDCALVVVKDATIVWNLATGSVAARIENKGRRPHAAALDRSATRAYLSFSVQSTTDRARAVVDHEIYDLGTGLRILHSLGDGVFGGWLPYETARAAFLSDGSVLAGVNGRLDLLAGADLAARAHAESPRKILDMALAPDESRALVTFGRQHAAPAFEFRVENAGTVALPTLAAAPLDMAGAAGTFLQDGRFVLGLTTGLLHREGVTVVESPRRFVAMSQVDGEILIADAGGGGLRLDPATLALLGEAGPADAPRLARARGDLSPDGSFRAALPVVEDPGLVMTRASDGAPLWEDSAITARAFAPDGKSIACGRSLSIGGLQRRMIESGVRISTCAPYSSQSNSGRLTAVAFSPDGRIAGADADGVVMMFQKDESREFGNTCYTLRRRVSGLVWHPDGTRIAVGLGGDRGTILLLGGRDAVYFCGHYSDVRALWFTPDGTRLVSAGTDGQCFVWDVPAS